MHYSTLVTRGRIGNRETLNCTATTMSHDHGQLGCCSFPSLPERHLGCSTFSESQKAGRLIAVGDSKSTRYAKWIVSKWATSPFSGSGSPVTVAISGWSLSRRLSAPTLWVRFLISSRYVFFFPCAFLFFLWTLPFAILMAQKFMICSSWIQCAFVVLGFLMLF